MITFELPQVLVSYANPNSVGTVDESCQTVRDALAALGSRFSGVVDRVMDVAAVSGGYKELGAGQCEYANTLQ